MPVPVSGEEAEEFSNLRSYRPETLYRLGTRKATSGASPEGRDLVVANLAHLLSRGFSNETLAILGAPGLIQISDHFVPEDCSVECESFSSYILTKRNRQRRGGRVERSPKNVAVQLWGELTQDEVRSVVEDYVVRTMQSSLQDILGNSDIFREDDSLFKIHH